MKKVVYVVTKVGRESDFKTKGVGYITDSGDLITACVSKKQKPYIRIYEDCERHCHLIAGTKDEYKGAHYELREIEFERPDGSKESRECELNYDIWYKIVE